MIGKIRWTIAGVLMSIAAAIQLAALKVMPIDTDMLERILKQSRTGEQPGFADVFEDE